MNYSLAIVIPAFKGHFLAKTLESIIRQTDQRFNLYVCNDASPDNLEAITRSVLGTRAHTYHHFETNLGRTSLPRHWNRCVALAREPWIWLFSDDDTMDSGCVEAFYRMLELAGETTDIFRFNAWVIDETGNRTALFPFHVDQESWLEFAYGRLMGWRRALMQQLICRRTAWERSGGYLDLPLGWSSDDAAIIAMSRHRPIRRIPGANINWRSSRKNITPDESYAVRKQKLRAMCLFLQWLTTQLKAPRETLFDNDEVAFANAMDRCLVEQILNHGSLPALANWSLLVRTRTVVSGGHTLSLLKHLAVTALSDGLSCLGGLRTILPRSGKS